MVLTIQYLFLDLLNFLFGNLLRYLFAGLAPDFQFVNLSAWKGRVAINLLLVEFLLLLELLLLFFGESWATGVRAHDQC